MILSWYLPELKTWEGNECGHFPSLVLDSSIADADLDRGKDSTTLWGSCLTITRIQRYPLRVVHPRSMLQQWRVTVRSVECFWGVAAPTPIKLPGIRKLRSSLRYWTVMRRRSASPGFGEQGNCGSYSTNEQCRKHIIYQYHSMIVNDIQCVLYDNVYYISVSQCVSVCSNLYIVPAHACSMSGGRLVCGGNRCGCGQGRWSGKHAAAGSDQGFWDETGLWWGMCVGKWVEPASSVWHQDFWTFGGLKPRSFIFMKSMKSDLQDLTRILWQLLSDPLRSELDRKFKWSRRQLFVLMAACGWHGFETRWPEVNGLCRISLSNWL